MNQFEKSAIIGYYRNGTDSATIAATMGISTKYVEIIIKEYLNKLKTT